MKRTKQFVLLPNRRIGVGPRLAKMRVSLSRACDLSNLNSIGNVSIPTEIKSSDATSIIVGNDDLDFSITHTVPADATHPAPELSKTFRIKAAQTVTISPPTDFGVVSKAYLLVIDADQDTNIVVADTSEWIVDPWHLEVVDVNNLRTRSSSAQYVDTYIGAMKELLPGEDVTLTDNSGPTDLILAIVTVKESNIKTSESLSGDRKALTTYLGASFEKTLTTRTFLI